MKVEIDLKNSEEKVLIDEKTLNFIKSNKHLSEIGFLDNLRRHSAGYAVFAKNFPLENGSYRNETIYLHKLIAEKFVPQQKSQQKLFVTFKNDNQLDCRIDNLTWLTMAELRRNVNKTKSETGYRGVSVIGYSNQKYRAVIYKGKERFDLGTFNSPEDAALAYNKKSIELFGETKSLNIIKDKKKVSDN